MAESFEKDKRIKTYEGDEQRKDKINIILKNMFKIDQHLI